MNDDPQSVAIGSTRLTSQQQARLGCLLPPHEPDALQRLAHALAMAYDMQMQTDTFVLGKGAQQSLDNMRVTLARVKRELGKLNDWSLHLFERDLSFDPITATVDMHNKCVAMCAHKGPAKKNRYSSALDHIADAFEIAFPERKISYSVRSVFHRVVAFYFASILKREVSARNEIKKLIEYRL